MDVRLFKLLVFVGMEGIQVLALFIDLHFFGGPDGTRVARLIYYTILLSTLLVPVLLLMPEDNWIWLLEEDLRSRKITLKSKAVKHLHLSMLYIMAISYPIFLVCTSLFIWSQWEVKYRFPPTWIMGAFAILFGIYCAYRNYRNVKKYDSLFAVGWDRKSSFLEIFIGIKVSRNMKFFYKGFSLAVGIIFFACAFLATPVYFKTIARYTDICGPYDRQKCIVMQAFYCVLFSISIWAVVMYTSFQILFTKRLEAWVREKKSTGGESK
jgi:hypothetical protein